MGFINPSQANNASVLLAIRGMPNNTTDPGLEDTQFPTHVLDQLYGAMSLLSGVIGFVGNGLIAKILLQHRLSLSARIFLAIAVTDMITSFFGAIPFSIPRLFPTKSGVFGVTALCNICGPLLNISERYSVFLIAVLSVTRAIALRCPLLYIKQSRIMVLMAMYFLVQTLMACLPFFNGVTYYYEEVYTLCTWTLDDIIDFQTQHIWYQITYHLLLFIPFFLPSIFVVASCFICVLSLKQSTITNNNSNKSKASITIVLFTVTYIVLHVPMWIFLVMFLATEHGKVSVDFSNATPTYLFIFSSKVSVYINAALNPIIYMSRTNYMQNSFKEDIRTAAVRLMSIRRTFTRTKVEQAKLPKMRRLETAENDGEKMLSFADDNANLYSNEDLKNSDNDHIRIQRDLETPQSLKVEGFSDDKVLIADSGQL